MFMMWNQIKIGTIYSMYYNEKKFQWASTWHRRWNTIPHIFLFAFLYTHDSESFSFKRDSTYVVINAMLPCLPNFTTEARGTSHG